MNNCSRCGVELEEGMKTCPLCGCNVNEQGESPQQHPIIQSFPYTHQEMTSHEKQATWEIVTIILLSGIVTTLFLNLILNKTITWSEYPVAICLSIFSYISVFAFSSRSSLFKIAIGCLLSAAFMLLIDALAGGINWTPQLGIPLLITGNVLVVMLVNVIYKNKNKGLNIIAYAMITIALYCIVINGILSVYRIGKLQFHWGLIVTACVLPVAFVLLFVHYRHKKGQSLNKTFHL